MVPRCDESCASTKVCKFYCKVPNSSKFLLSESLPSWWWRSFPADLELLHMILVFSHWFIHLFEKIDFDSPMKNKGPDNPTCQLLPTSSKRKVKMAWGKQEREKRWWRIGVEQVVCGRVSTSKLCMDKLCCMHVCMYACMDVCMDG